MIDLTPIARIVIAVVAAALLVATFFIAKCSYDRSVVNKHEQQVQAQAKPANDQAANERATDTITQTQHEQELHNVIAAQPDQPIAPTTRALSCDRLRKLGRAPAACR